MSDQKSTALALIFPVSADGRAVIKCPSCGTCNQLDVSRFKKRTIPLLYTCSCGKSFSCLFNFSLVRPETADTVRAGYGPDEKDFPLVEVSTEPSSQQHTAALRKKKAQTVSNSVAAQVPPNRETGRTQVPQKGRGVLTVPVDAQGRARIVCPHCNHAKAVALKTGPLSGKVIPVTCGCGESFSCRFVPQQRIAAAGKRNVYFPLLKGELAGRKSLVFHVDSKGEATIICPNCNNYKIISPSKDPSLNGVCAFHCKCGKTFPFKIDFRRAYRKPVDLEGTFYNYRQEEKGELRVKNLSLGGIGISVEGEALDGVHGFKIGDIMEVSFCLDDAMRSEVNRRVEVRTISGSSIGCQFSDHKAHDKELGFYLMV